MACTKCDLTILRNTYEEKQRIKRMFEEKKKRMAAAAAAAATESQPAVEEPVAEITVLKKEYEAPVIEIIPEGRKPIDALVEEEAVVPKSTKKRSKKENNSDTEE